MNQHTHTNTKAKAARGLKRKAAAKRAAERHEANAKKAQQRREAAAKRAEQNRKASELQNTARKTYSAHAKYDENIQEHFAKVIFVKQLT